MQLNSIGALALMSVAACTISQPAAESPQPPMAAVSGSGSQPAPSSAGVETVATSAPVNVIAAPDSRSQSAAAGAVAVSPAMMGSAGAAAVSGMPASSGPPGMSTDPESGEVVFRTEPVSLAAFDEAYTCMGITVQEDMVIDGFKKGTQAFVHHAQFVKALWPEPEGISNCPEQFKITWMPIFLAGAGASELRFDEGVGHVIPAGTQLVLQMHLYNASDKPVKEPVEIRMHKSKSPNPTPVTPWAIGSSEINIMPKQAGSAQNVCTQTNPVEVLAVFPHMHQLGAALKIEVGKSLDAMKPLYARDPFNFDDQRMEKMKLKLEAGDMLRVTCDFKVNEGNSVIGFGESSDDEMCFFVGFALGDAPAQADCGNLWDALLTL